MSSISLGTTVIPRGKEKQILCRILGGKQGVLWEMCKMVNSCISKTKAKQNKTTFDPVLVERQWFSEFSVRSN